MKLRPVLLSLATLGLINCWSEAGAVTDGKAEVDGKTQQVALAKRTWFPDDPAGLITLGTQFSSDLSGVYFDSMLGLWAPQSRDAFLFMDSRYHWEDNDQFISSSGLGFRVKCPDHDMIFGVNAYWDSLHSEAGNDFGQLGLGAEILTKWVDARFNYYAPDDERYEVGRSSNRDDSRSLGPEFASGRFVARDLRETSRRESFRRYEAALEGYNAELGFLVPGLDRYAEVRVFGGFYHYDNPFGSDFQGFKARLEARLLPGVIADLEYWDDAELMGGHWTAGARVSVPFSIVKLATGHNPFEGIADSFRPRQRDFSERMSEMVIRSHRVQTTSSGDIPSGTSTSTKVTTVPVRLRTAADSRLGGGSGFPVE